MTKINITGDFVINKPYGTSNIDEALIRLFKQSDINIVNLEAPVTESNIKILKTGPNIKADKKDTTSILKTLNIDVATLANNHVLDYDEQGVKDTLAFCEENNIQSVGAGMNIKEASKTLYLDTEEGKIAFVNFAENEWASATENTAGANPMNIVRNVRHIKAAKTQADFVFVIVHGGHEYYNLPSPRMQEQYRFYAESGADLVVGHHTHCIIGNEHYNGVPIYYSLGNFLFTKKSSYATWYTGLVLSIEIVDGKFSVQQHSVRQTKGNFKIQLLNGGEKEEVEGEIQKMNKIISDASLLDDYWNKFIEQSCKSYLNMWSPSRFFSNRYLRAAFKKTIGKRILNKKGIALSMNLLRCEAHRDLSEAVFNRYLNK